MCALKHLQLILALQSLSRVHLAEQSPSWLCVLLLANQPGQISRCRVYMQVCLYNTSQSFSARGHTIVKKSVLMPASKSSTAEIPPDTRLLCFGTLVVPPGNSICRLRLSSAADRRGRSQPWLLPQIRYSYLIKSKGMAMFGLSQAAEHALCNLDFLLYEQSSAPTAHASAPHNMLVLNLRPTTCRTFLSTYEIAGLDTTAKGSC